MTKPRVWMSNRKPASGEIVKVRAMVAHQMETGMRRRATGETIPRNIINTFTCELAGQRLFSWQLDTSVSPSPYLEFRFVASESGDLIMHWRDDQETDIEARERIDVVS